MSGAAFEDAAGVFRVDGRTQPLRAAAMHYWRLERDVWDGILQRIASLGFTAVSTYVPWEAHEVSRGVFDFGTTDRRLDLDAFLTSCRTHGLHVVVRPGPQINGEMTWFGFPRRIVADDALQARSAAGSRVVLTQVPRPIPALSYANDRFFDETALWFDAVCPILVRHAHPHGAVIAAQADNEMAFFFCLNAYSSDYSDAALARYRDFLREKYGEIGELERTYHRRYEGFASVEPPRRFDARAAEDIPAHVDWVEYRERYLVDGVGRIADMMRGRGVDVPLFHNYPHPLGAAGPDSGYTTPFNLTALEARVDFVGHDIYFRKELYENLKTVVSYVSTTSRYPYAPELFTGTWPWFLDPAGDADEEFIAKATLMHGLKGYSRYTFVERDRWLNSPIRQDGSVRQNRCDMFERVNMMAERHGFAALRRTEDVLLLANRDYDRLEAASVLLSFPGDFLETPTSLPGYPDRSYVSDARLGLQQPVQIAKADRFLACYRGLTDAGFGLALSDTTLDPARWRDRRAVVLATFEYLDHRLALALVAYASDGGTIVLGPLVPDRNERMEPDDTIALALRAGDAQTLDANGRPVGTSHAVGRGKIVHLTDLSDAATAMAAALDGTGAIPIRRSDARLDVVVQSDPDDAGRLVVFVCNPTEDVVDADIDLGRPLEGTRDLWREQPLDAPTRLRDRLAAYEVGIYECRAVR